MSERKAIVNRASRLSDPAQGHHVELDGEYDFSRKRELVLLFASLPLDAPATIDLTRVTYVDSTFLHALASLRVRLKKHGVTLVGANPAIRRLLGIVRFEQLFRIAES